jgi:hypothetical protein
MGKKIKESGNNSDRKDGSKAQPDFFTGLSKE